MFVSLGDQDKQSYNLLPLIYVHLCALGRKTSEHDPFIFHENTVPAKMSKCGLILSGFFGKDSRRGFTAFPKGRRSACYPFKRGLPFQPEN